MVQVVLHRRSAADAAPLSKKAKAKLSLAYKISSLNFSSQGCLDPSSLEENELLNDWNRIRIIARFEGECKEAIAYNHADASIKDLYYRYSELLDSESEVLGYLKALKRIRPKYHDRFKNKYIFQSIEKAINKASALHLLHPDEYSHKELEEFRLFLQRIQF